MEVFPTNDGCDISTQQAQKDFTSLGHALLHTGCDLPLLLLLVGFSENKFRREHSETIEEADIPETLQENLLSFARPFAGSLTRLCNRSSGWSRILDCPSQG